MGTDITIDFYIKTDKSFKDLFWVVRGVSDEIRAIN